MATQRKPQDADTPVPGVDPAPTEGPGTEANQPPALTSDPPAGAAADASPSPTLAYSVIARTGLVVRSGPGPEFPILHSLPFGSSVDVLKREGAWALVDRVGDGATDGFVFFAFLKEGATPASAAPSVSPQADGFVLIKRPLLQSIMDRCANTPNVRSKLDLDVVADALNRAMIKAQAMTRLREVAFLSQAVIETDYFRTFREYFGERASYAPFFGRGMHQLTHRDTYDACSQALYGNDTLVQNPDMILNDIEVNINATAWYWREAKPFNTLADAGDIDEIIHRLYGGTINSPNPNVRQSVLLRRSFYKTIGGLLDQQAL